MRPQLLPQWIPVAQQLGDPDFGATPTLFTGIIGGQSELQPGQQVSPQPAKNDLANYQANQKGGQ